MYENKKIMILGMARSGYEAAKLLADKNNVIVTDSKEQDSEHVLELTNMGVSVIITDKPDTILDDSFNLLIKNPGIRRDHDCVVKAKELNIPVINEVEMAYHMLPNDIKIIGVTGSNGKTTTVTLINEFLKKANLPVFLGGNIGYPLSSLVNKVKSGDILLLEISDHQLVDMYDFKTDISVITNISPTHLDFHSSYDEYKSVKKKIFNHHTINDLAIINYNNEEAMNLTSDLVDKKEYFGYKDAYVLDNKIIVGDIKIDLNDIKVKGMHNYENIMAAILVAVKFGVGEDVIKGVLNDFNGVEHRIEYVTEFNGVKVYNDSKSTNNMATITALKSFEQPVILILGGLNRGQDYNELLPFMQHVKYVICYGEVKDILNEFMLEHGFKTTSIDTIKNATKLAVDESVNGDVILLSPAHASWDQYKCFEDRGNEFKSDIKELVM